MAKAETQTRQAERRIASKDGRQRRRFWPRARKVIQGLSLALFGLLFLATLFPPTFWLPVDLFLRIDPLISLSVSLADRQLAQRILWAVPLIVATIVLGRFFCAWICPLGTVLDVARMRRKQAVLGRETTWRNTKTILLGFVFAAALIGSLAYMWLDPLSLLERTMATAVVPMLNQGMLSALQAAYNAGILPDVMSNADQSIRQAVFPAQPLFFWLAAPIIGIFLAVLVLNLVAHRFWCRYLCPLGALYGLLSRPAAFRRQVSDACDGCNRCMRNCRMGAIQEGGKSTRPGECIACVDCVAECPKGAVSFGLGTPAPRYDPSRRQALGVLGASVVLAAGLRMDGTKAGQATGPVRPPGAQHDDFLQRCVRCGACIKVCPTGLLQPSLFEAGIEGAFTPMVVGRSGYCEWTCTSCGQVCPTGAIQSLALDAKQNTIIGTAYIDKNRCIPWADDTPCIVCEEVCPLPEKAIVLDQTTVTSADGTETTLGRPRVIRESCIGCALCEFKCPVPRPAAIHVYNSAGDPRLSLG